MKNTILYFAGICINIGQKYCDVLIPSVFYADYGKKRRFIIDPKLKKRRKELLGQKLYLTKQGYVTTRVNG